jgi:hypothetical protein
MIKRYLAKRDNPWELLVIAAFSLLPGIALFIHHGPVVLIANGTPTRFADATLLSEIQARVFGGFGVLFALVLIALYFYVRRSSVREQRAPPPHFLDL